MGENHWETESDSLGFKMMETVVFTLGDSKEASLYFDRVVPLGLILDSINEFGEGRFKTFDGRNKADWDALCEARNKFDFLLPESIQNNPEFRELLATANMVALYKLADSLEPSSGRRLFEKAVPQSKRERDALIRKCVRLVGAKKPYFGTSARLLAPADSQSDDAMLTIKELSLIDTERLSMEKIAAFRQDPNSRAKLRRLRLFAMQNYSGKSKSFVQDDLMSKIDDYEQEIRRWSFETKTAGISMLFSSKILAGAAGGGFVGAILGSPGLSLTSMAMGAAVEFGRIGVELSRKKFEARKSLGENPVSYISEAIKISKSSEV